MGTFIFSFNIGKYEIGMRRDFCWWFNNGYTKQFMWWYIYKEELVSEDLEEAVNAYIGYAPEVDESPFTYGKRQAFKDGAKWQKEQMIKDAMSCTIEWYDGFVPNFTEEQLHDALRRSNINVGDKVKVIIIKED